MTQFPLIILLYFCIVITGINKEAVPRSRKTSMEIRNEAAAAGAMEGKHNITIITIYNVTDTRYIHV